MLIVKVLGPGCPNCQRLEQETRAALDGAYPRIEYEVIKVTDYADIVSYGVMSTPALVIDEKVVSAGRTPKAEQIVQWAREMQK